MAPEIREVESTTLTRAERDHIQQHPVIGVRNDETTLI